MEIATLDRDWRLPWYWRIVLIGLFCLPGYLWGPIFLVLMIPQMAFLLAPLLMEIPGGYVGLVRRHLWEPEQGNYYAFDGCQIRIHIDEAGEARGNLYDILVALRHVGRKTLLRGTLMRLAVPAGAQGKMAVGLAAIIAAMHRVPEPDVIRFRQWFERQVVMPARRRHGQKVGAGRTAESAISPATWRQA